MNIASTRIIEIVKNCIEDNKQRRLELDEKPSEIKPTLSSIENALRRTYESARWSEDFDVDEETAIEIAIGIVCDLK